MKKDQKGAGDDSHEEQFEEKNKTGANKDIYEDGVCDRKDGSVIIR